MNNLHALLVSAGFHPGDKVVVGISGGPDSLALLHQLCQVVKPADLVAAHLDHSLRPQSVADAQFVRDIAEEWRVRFFTKRVDAAAAAVEHGYSLEEAAREVRYTFLADVARQMGARIVAVGHNADDQAETVLLHLLRGSGLTGLRGMQSIGLVPGAHYLYLVRPLLDQTRLEIETYCAVHGLQWLQDETNLDTNYKRNHIRHILIPELQRISPQIKRHLNRLANIVAADDDALLEQTEAAWPELLIEAGPDWIVLSRQRWNDLSSSLQRRTLRRAVTTLNPEVSDLSFESIKLAVQIASRRTSGLETMLPGNVRMVVDHDRLQFTYGSDEVGTGLPQLIDEKPVPIPVPGKARLANGWLIAAQFVEETNTSFYEKQDPWQVVISLPTIEPLIMRARRHGERMQPLGMNGHSASLQDIMVNRKIAARLRGRWPIIAAGELPLWLVGHIIDHRARVTPESINLVKLSCRKYEDGV